MEQLSYSSPLHNKEKNARSVSEFEFIHDPKDKSAKLGTGSFATVKLARERKTGQLFALKLVDTSPNKATASEIYNLKVEITLHKKLNHANIIKCHDYMQADPFVYLILDYAENGNLYLYHQRKKQLTELEIFRFFHQTCLAIDYLHKNNIMHRDIKPENLLLDKNFNIKLCDFGWAAQNINDKRLTFCGTYEYMAPEIVHKTPYDYRVDIWSLGVLLFELIHRIAPYRGRTLPDITKSLAAKTIDFSSSTDPQAKDLILNILKVNPVERLSLQQIFSHPWILKNLGKQDGLIKQPSASQTPVPKKNDNQTMMTDGIKKVVIPINSVNPTKQLSIYFDQQHPQQLGSSYIDSANALFSSTLTSFSGLPNTNKSLNISQSRSLNHYASNGTTTSSNLNKSQEVKKYRIFTSEPQAQEPTVTLTKSPLVHPPALGRSLEPISNDKENNDYMSFTALSNIRRRENISQHFTIANLNSSVQSPSTINFLESKEILAINRQYTGTYLNRQLGVSVDTMKRRNIFENTSSTPPPKFKLAEIVDQITQLTLAPPFQYTALAESRSPLQLSYLNQIPKESLTKPSTDSNQKPQTGMLASTRITDDLKNKFISSQVKARPPLAHNNRSFSSALNFENKQRSARPGFMTSHPTGLGFFNHPRGLRCHQGDEIVPSLKGSFSGASLPFSINTQNSSRENPKNFQVELNFSQNDKSIQETEGNAIPIKTEDDQVPLNISFSKFYNGLKAKKKLDFSKSTLIDVSKSTIIDVSK